MISGKSNKWVCVWQRVLNCSHRAPIITITIRSACQRWVELIKLRAQNRRNLCFAQMNNFTRVHFFRLVYRLPIVPRSSHKTSFAYIHLCARLDLARCAVNNFNYWIKVSYHFVCHGGLAFRTSENTAHAQNTTTMICLREKHFCKLLHFTSAAMAAMAALSRPKDLDTKRNLFAGTANARQSFVQHFVYISVAAVVVCSHLKRFVSV